MQVIRFGKDRYHLIEKMQSWCQENVGAGGWTQGYRAEEWMGIRKWSIECTFGTTRLTFKEDADATFFLLHWK
jgi:hypothetical protein